MKTIKITKKQLNTLLSMNNPLILYRDYIVDGDVILCEEDNSKYIITEIINIGKFEHEVKDYIKITEQNINLYNWEEEREKCFPNDIYFNRLIKLEKIIQSKDIDLSLLEHK